METAFKQFEKTINALSELDQNCESGFAREFQVCIGYVLRYSLDGTIVDNRNVYYDLSFNKMANGLFRILGLNTTYFCYFNKDISAIDMVCVIIHGRYYYE